MPNHAPPLAELLKTRTSLAKELEGNPIFQALQHVDNAIAVLQANKAESVADKVTGNIIRGGLTTPQRDAIAEAAAKLFIETKNAPMTVKRLCEELRRLGIPLPDAEVASVGGILGKRKAMFVKSREMDGHWQLTPEYYAEHTNSGPQG